MVSTNYVGTIFLFFFIFYKKIKNLHFRNIFFIFWKRKMCIIKL
jgi:hypothetical protein